MAITRKKKEQLVGVYGDLVGGAVNTIVLSQVGLTVNEVNNLRKQLKKIGGQLMIVKKRLLLKSLSAGHVESIEHAQLPGSLMLLISKDESSPFAPLKAINDYVKMVKKEGLPYQVKYVGGWIEKTWKEDTYVSELANLPSKEELISKLLYLMKYPVTSFARVISEVAKK
ncbi:MAG: 50S ribosomal protein L10 [Candidatus Absconditabacterales bacterium]